MIDTPVFKHLARLGKLGDVVAKQIPGGFMLLVREGLEEDVLTAQRGGIRTFKKLDSVSSYLSDVGVEHFTVELESFGRQEALKFPSVR